MLPIIGAGIALLGSALKKNEKTGKSAIGNLVGNVFKKKEGGTAVGNMFRGLFGKKKPDTQGENQAPVYATSVGPRYTLKLKDGSLPKFNYDPTANTKGFLNTNLKKLGAVGVLIAVLIFFVVKSKKK